MVAPLALILRAPGTNCDVETERAFQLAGARTCRIHLNQLFQQSSLLAESQIVCLPGGFSYGDDIAAGRIFARRLADRFGDSLQQFRDRGGLILGICNGFQVLLQLDDLLQARGHDTNMVTLTANRHGRFEARWVGLAVTDSPSVFTRGLTFMYLPVAHAEGRIALSHPGVVQQLRDTKRIAMRYAAEKQGTAAGELYPDNPNGSIDDIAALCDRTGRVLGMMPHPERYVQRLHHPRWTRGEGADPGDGLRLFLNAVEYCR